MFERRARAHVARLALIRCALVSALAVGTAGCQTLDSYNDPDLEGSPVYSGTRRDLSYLGPLVLSLNVPMLMMTLVDLPFSFVADTVLLPVTLPRGSARAEQIEEIERLDAEVPSPIEAGADEAPLEIARRLFEACQKLTETLDSRLTDCYSIDARITLESGDEPARVESGTRYKQSIRDSLPGVRHQGDYVTYRDVEYTQVPGGVRIRAELARAFTGSRTLVSFLVGPSADGQWRILEESGPGWR